MKLSTVKNQWIFHMEFFFSYTCSRLINIKNTYWQEKPILFCVFPLTYLHKHIYYYLVVTNINREIKLKWMVWLWQRHAWERLDTDKYDVVYVGMTVELHVFLIPTLESSKWSASRLSRFIPGETTCGTQL